MSLLFSTSHTFQPVVINTWNFAGATDSGELVHSHLSHVGAEMGEGEWTLYFITVREVASSTTLTYYKGTEKGAPKHTFSAD